MVHIPHAQESVGTTFSVDAFSQLQWRADCFPQLHLALTVSVESLESNGGEIYLQQRIRTLFHQSVRSKLERLKSLLYGGLDCLIEGEREGVL